MLLFLFLLLGQFVVDVDNAFLAPVVTVVAAVAAVVASAAAAATIFVIVNCE